MFLNLSPDIIYLEKKDGSILTLEPSKVLGEDGIRMRYQFNSLGTVNGVECKTIEEQSIVDIDPTKFKEIDDGTIVVVAEKTALMIHKFGVSNVFGGRKNIKVMSVSTIQQHRTETEYGTVYKVLIDYT